MCYDKAVEKAKKLQIDELRLPRCRKQPKWYDQGSCPHVFAAPKEYFRQQCFGACDLMLGELDDRFNQPSLSLVVAMENTLVNAANALAYDEPLTILKNQITIIISTMKSSCPFARYNQTSTLLKMEVGINKKYLQ